MKLTFIDLCSGIGGMRLGMERAGGTCLYSCEKDIPATVTYKTNFDDDSTGDLTKTVTENIPKYGILMAGFPCQAFSVAGPRLGFKDTRGTIFFDIVRILKETNPPAFFLENVKGLIGHNKGQTLRVMQNILTDLGYHLYIDTLSPHTHCNIPQNRERVFIVGFKDQVDFTFPEKMPLTVKWRRLIDKKKQEDRYYYRNPKSPSHVKIMEQVKSKDCIYQYRRYYIRENKTGICPTLTANMGTGGHNVPLIIDKWGIRKLTPRECARFQGFQDSFILPKIGAGSGDAHLYKQIGNSVCIPLIEKIGKGIAKCLT